MFPGTHIDGTQMRMKSFWKICLHPLISFSPMSSFEKVFNVVVSLSSPFDSWLNRRFYILSFTSNGIKLLAKLF